MPQKYEGSDYNGKMLYKKSLVNNMFPDQAQQRQARLKELEKKYKESLKVLKMVEDSKQNHQVSASGVGIRHDAVGRLLQSPGASTAAVAALGLSGLSPAVRITNLQVATAQLEAELAVQRAVARNQSLGLQARMASTYGRVPRLPFPVQPRNDMLPFRRGEAIASLKGNQSSHRAVTHSLFRNATNPYGSDSQTSIEAAMVNDVLSRTGLVMGGAVTARSGGALKKNSHAAAVLRQSWPTGSHSQAMLLPNTITTLHSSGVRDVEGEPAAEQATDKKSAQNDMILTALSNLNTDVFAAVASNVTTSSAQRKRRIEEPTRTGTCRLASGAKIPKLN